MCEAESRQYLQTEGMDLAGCLGARDGRGGDEVNLEQIVVPDQWERDLGILRAGGQGRCWTRAGCLINKADHTCWQQNWDLGRR